MIALKMLSLIVGGCVFTAVVWTFWDWVTGEYRKGWWWQRW